MRFQKPPVPIVPASVSDPGQRDWMQKITDLMARIAGERGSAAQASLFEKSVGEGLFNPPENLLGPVEYDPSKDLTIPDAPTLTGKGAFSYVILELANHDNLRNISYAEIWGTNAADFETESAARNRNNAVLIGTATGGVFSHATDTNYTGYYWARYYTYSNLYSAWSSTSGLKLSTSEDPTALLATLQEKVSEDILTIALNERINLIDNPENGVLAQIFGLNTIIEGQADSILQLNTMSEGNTAAIEQAFSSIDGIHAQYTVKLDVNGSVSGFGLASTANDYDSSVHSRFYVNVDTFAITHPGSESLVFAVDNGKVLMDAAYIVNLTVNDAQIQSLAADKIFANGATIASVIIGDGDIDNAKIGNIIESDNYQAGSSGWRIHKNGGAEFRNIFARGNIEATSIKANTVEAKHLIGGAVSTMDTVSKSGVTLPPKSEVFVGYLDPDIPSGLNGDILILANYSGAADNASTNLGVKFYKFVNGATNGVIHKNEMSVKENFTESGATSAIWKNAPAGSRIAVYANNTWHRGTIINGKVNANLLSTLM